MQGLQLLAGISFLIVLHEFGHFFFARFFKTRVDKFYLFFDFLFPVSTLFNFSLFKKKVGDTEFGIGWFPLGGYVKIAGMVDESMDKEALAKPPEPWEYRSKKAWQRLFIMLGGIIMNIIVAIVLYMIVFSVWGEEFLPMKNVKYGIAVDSIGKSIGLQNGDMIMAIDEKPIERFEQIPLALILHKENGNISIRRHGKDTMISIPFGTINKIIKADRNSFIRLRMPSMVDSIRPGTIAATTQLHKGDSIVSVNNTPVAFQDEISDVMKANAGQPLAVAYLRGGHADTVHATVPKDSTLGIYFGPGERYYDYAKIKYNPFTALGRGASYTLSRLQIYIAQFKLFGSKEVKVNESVGGFVSMGKMYQKEFDWQAFLMMTAFISVALAFMNFLPIPGLDGGYVIFLLYEIITGRQVSEKVMERATTVGLVLLLALMAYVNGLDILRLFHVKVS